MRRLVTNNGHSAVRIDADNRVHIDDLVVDDEAFLAVLRQLPESEHDARTRDVIRVGSETLLRVGLGRHLDYVRAQVLEQTKVVADEVAKIPVKVSEDLLKQVGVNDGQALAPVRELVDGTARLLKDRLESVQRLLAEDIDPRRVDGVLGRIFATLTALLDPARADSVQAVLETVVRDVARDDGTLVCAVRKALDAGLKPLREEVDRLAKEVRAQQAVDAALATTTAKGADFEQELLATLQCWAHFTGAEVQHVGGDRKPGDLVVIVHDDMLADEQFRLVIEARDDTAARGRKRIADDIAAAMKTREAHFGLYIAKSAAGLAREIGDWAEGHCGHGAFLACTANHLVTALRFALVQRRIQALLAARPETDTTALEQQLERIRTAARRLRTIKTRAGDTRRNADAICTEAEELQRELSEALAAAEDALRGAIEGAPERAGGGRRRT